MSTEMSFDQKLKQAVVRSHYRATYLKGDVIITAHEFAKAMAWSLVYLTIEITESGHTNVWKKRVRLLTSECDEVICALRSDAAMDQFFMRKEAARDARDELVNRCEVDCIYVGIELQLLNIDELVSTHDAVRAAREHYDECSAQFNTTYTDLFEENKGLKQELAVVKEKLGAAQLLSENLKFHAAETITVGREDLLSLLNERNQLRSNLTACQKLNNTQLAALRALPAETTAPTPTEAKRTVALLHSITGILAETFELAAASLDAVNTADSKAQAEGCRLCITMTNATGKKISVEGNSIKYEG